MTLTLRYGAERTLSLDLPSQALVAHCQLPHGEPLTDVAGAIDRALGEPLAFPPLAQAAVPGDKVALALTPGVPHAATLVARTIDAVVSGGVSPEDITVVCGDSATATARPLAEVPAEMRALVVVEVHDPAHRGALSYLAASADAKPIYINRTIYDADLVVPIGCLHPEGVPGPYELSSSLFPVFSDEASQTRYQTAHSHDPIPLKRLGKAANEVSWLLGFPFSIQVVRGAGDQILHVLAGERQAVLREGNRLCDEAWNTTVPHRAELVIATIEGGPDEQTWENVARALLAASACTVERGAIAICTDLAQCPGPALEHLVGAEDFDAVLHELSHHHMPDLWMAHQLVLATERGKIFLISQLNDDLVEDLALVPLGGEQLSRLASRFGSCIVLANAPYALARPINEQIQSELIKSRK